MEQKRNIFSRVLTIILIVFIAFLIVMSFLFSNQSYIITSGIVTCLAILVILCLSEVFDNFSIGKIITLNKNIKEVNRENERLRNQNFNLISQMINIKNSNNQNVSINLEGSRNIEDIKNDVEVKEMTDIQETSDVKLTDMETRRKRFRYMRVSEVLSLKKVMEDLPESAENQYEVRVKDNFSIEDEIMNENVRYDAHSHFGKNDIFYEVKTTVSYSSIYELYYMIHLAKKYGELNNTMSKLMLIIPAIEENNSELGINSDRIINRINFVEKAFEPAIKNGLLEVKRINITIPEIEEEISKTDKN